MGDSVRKIVKIDEAKCDGCGECVPSCAEGAIQIVDGKARLISETYCDGLGACLGECPTGAITIEERPAEAFDEVAVKDHLSHQSQPAAACPGSAAQSLMSASGPAGGCPGAALRDLQSPETHRGDRSADEGATGDSLPPSRLAHWPIQLRLVPPGAPFLTGADIVVCADCVPFVVADFHQRYLDGRAVLVGCPKLDDLDEYRQKLRQIVAQAKPVSLTVIRMEVPCCAGIAHAVREARDLEAPDLPMEIHTIGIQGSIQRERVPARSA